MSPYEKQQRKKQRKKIFRKWHRRIGFTASLFLFNLAITGLLLNHYEALSLHKNYIQSAWLLDWYGVKAPQNFDCAQLKLATVCQLDDQIYYTSGIAVKTESRLLSKNNSHLVNLIDSGLEIYLITSTRIDVFNRQFELLESLELSLQQTPIVDAMVDNDGQILIANQQQWFTLDKETFELLLTDGPLVNPKELVGKRLSLLAEGEVRQSIVASYRRQQISQLKFVQDLHSGQILNLPGKLLADLAAIAILLLAISGFITWQRRKNNPSE